MRVLFDLGHPAHFHLLRHVIADLRRRGEDVRVVARQKDCLPDLLREAQVPFHLVPRKKTGLVALGCEAIRAFVIAAKLAMHKPFDLLLGNSIVVGPLGRLTGTTSVVFNEDDAKAVPIQALLSYSPANFVVTPRCLRFEKHGLKHLTYPGYEELGYLHPRRFSPDPNIRKDLGLGKGQRYFLVRLVALTAHHDIGERGLSRAQARAIIDRLQEHGRVFLSTEAPADSDLAKLVLPTPAERIFDVLAFADLVVGDSQTVTAEAAVLGTPSLRCNTFVGRLAYLEELEHRYGLTAGFRPHQFDQLMARLDEWLHLPNRKQEWQRRRQVMLAECVDLTDWILSLVFRLVKQGRDGRR